MRGVSHLEVDKQDLNSLGFSSLLWVSQQATSADKGISMKRVGFKLGECYEAQKKFDHARGCYEVAAKEGSKEACLWLKDYHASEGRKARSYCFNLRASKIESEPDNFLPDTSAIIEARAQKAFDKGDFELVVALLVNASLITDQSFYLMGASCYKLSEKDPSLVGLREQGLSCLRLEHVGSKIFLGDIQMAEKKYGEACESYKQAIRCRINCPTPAELLEARSKLAQAEQALRL